MAVVVGLLSGRMLVLVLVQVVQVQVTLAAISHVCGPIRVPDAEAVMEHAMPTLRMWVLLLRRGSPWRKPVTAPP